MMFRFGPLRNYKPVAAMLKRIPHGSKKEAVIGIAEYLVGNEQHGFRKDDSYRQTTRAAVYGKQWQSDAQRRYVMAAIRSGEIVLGQRKNTPTDASRGYGYKLTYGGYGATITNDKEGAYWTRIWGGWKNWKNAGEVVTNNIKGAMRHAVARVNRILGK